MIAIIGAMEVEVQNLLSQAQAVENVTIHGHVFYKAVLCNHQVVITQLGIGKVNASINLTLMLSHFDIHYIINTGIAGGLKPLQINDVIVSDRIYYYDVDIQFFGYQYGQVAGEPEYYQSSSELKQLVRESTIDCKIAHVCSGDKFVTSVDLLNDILKVNSDISVADMESAALAHVAHRFAVPFLVIRTISDIINDNNQLEKYNEEESALKAQTVLLDVLAHIQE